MLSNLFSLLIYNPLYNGLVFFVDILPGGDLGFALIFLTLLVKLILFPISLNAVRTQMIMREIEEPLKEIKEKYKDDRQVQAQKTMELYREKGLNPFSSIALIFLQLPIIFGLYFVFAKGGFPSVDPTLLYPFISIPEHMNINFLGLIDLTEKSMVLAALAGATQFLQTKLSLPPLKPRVEGEASFKDDFARSFQLQMRYILPIVVTVVAYIISAAIALYWLTSNLFMIAQELYIRRKVKREKADAINDTESQLNPIT